MPNNPSQSVTPGLNIFSEANSNVSFAGYQQVGAAAKSPASVASVSTGGNILTQPLD